MSLRRAATLVLPILAPMLLMVTACSCWVRFDVVAPDALGHHVRASLREPEVRDELARRVGRAVAAEDPRAGAAEPLIRSAAALVIESRQFADVMDIAVHLTVRAVLDGRSSDATRLSDLETQLRATVEQLDPQFAARIPVGWDTQIIDLRASAPLPRTMRAAALLARAWGVLLGVTALVYGAWIGAAHRRRAALAIAGLSAVAAGVTMLIADRMGRTLLLRSAEVGPARRAAGAAFDVTTAGWRSISFAVLLGGALVTVAATSGTRLTAALRPVGSVARSVARTPQRRAGRLAWALGSAGIGVVLILGAPDFGPAVVTVIGIALVFVAVTAIGQTLPESPAPVRSGRGAFVTALCAIGILATPLALLAVSRGNAAAGDAELRCNGWSALCDRPVDETVFAGTHNSMASADAGFLFATQTGTIADQLQGGVRSLLVDTHYGLATQTGLVFTDIRDADRAALVDELGADTVANVERLRASVLPTTADPDVYLCHEYCELGATPAVDAFASIRSFLERNPAEVIVVFIQDETEPKDTIGALERSGLARYAYAHPPDEPWPTLGELVRAATPLIVMSERHGGAADWFLPAFAEFADTTYRATNLDQLTCERNRGPDDAPLLLVNAWVNADPPSVALARQVNSADFLADLADRCRRARRHLINVVAVNFWREGDLMGAVDRMNDLEDRAP